jgi:uncharacterized iron-regulated membrane protein
VPTVYLSMTRKVLFQIHLWLALVAGAFIFILGATGSIMAFEPELDYLLHRSILHVEPGDKPMSLVQLGAVAAKAYPGDTIQGYVRATKPDVAYQVLMEKTGNVCINPYTGQITGVRGDAREFLDYVHQLHLRLLWQHNGDPGGKIMSWVAVCAALLTILGLWLWWPIKRVTIQRGATGRRWWFDLHNAVGVFSLVFVLALAISGVLIGFDKTTVPWFHRIAGSQPARPPKVPPPPQDATPSVSPDQAVAVAREAIPGAEPFLVVSATPRDPYLVRMRFPEDLTPGGRSRVIVDRYTGKVLFALGSRTAPGGERIQIAVRAIHTGDILGMPSKIVMSLASAAMALQFVAGLAMWWKRTRHIKTAQSR